MRKFLPYADPSLDNDIDAVRLGMLTYRGVVKDSMQRKRKLLFTCDCGRVVVVPFPAITVLDTPSNKHIEGIPWSCGECGAAEVGPKKRPWGMKYSYDNWKPGPRRKALRTRRRKSATQCEKELHKPEWFAWQQAKRISKGVVARWKQFKYFYKDLGDRPAGAHLAKHDASRPHGPENSYWKKQASLHWGGSPVTNRWVTQQFNIPRTYVMQCKKAGIYDVQVIIAMHQSNKVPSKCRVK